MQVQMHTNTNFNIRVVCNGLEGSTRVGDEGARGTKVLEETLMNGLGD